MIRESVQMQKPAREQGPNMQPECYALAHARVCSYAQSRRLPQKIVVPKLKKQESPKLFMMAGHAFFMFADERLHVIGFEQTLDFQSAGSVHFVHQRI